MPDLLTADNLPEVLTAIAGLATAVGGWTLWRVRKEPPPAGSPDAFQIAITENTRAMNRLADEIEGQNRQFADNNKLFGEVLHHVDGMAKDFTEARQHLAALREQGNRRAR